VAKRVTKKSIVAPRNLTRTRVARKERRKGEGEKVRMMLKVLSLSPVMLSEIQGVVAGKAANSVTLAPLGVGVGQVIPLLVLLLMLQ
jgi:ribosomal protein S19